MKQHYFIVGTDTEIGKTFCAAALLHKAKSQGLSTLGLKPVAAGSEKNTDRSELPELVNEDALSLIDQSTIKL